MAASSRSTLFGRAVERILGSWTALQLAAIQGFGGVDSDEKAKWMTDAVETWFKENANIETYELEDFLADVLNYEFDTIADDGSLSQISQLICSVYPFCESEQIGEVESRLQHLPEPQLQGCLQAQDQPEIEVVEEEEMEASGGHPAQASSGLNSQMQGSNQAEASTQHSSEAENDPDSMETEEEDGWEVVRRGKKR